MIFAEITDINLNYLQTKGKKHYLKNYGIENKNSIFFRQPNIFESSEAQTKKNFNFFLNYRSISL